MKTARFLFAIVAFGSLSLGLGFAGEPPKSPSEKDPHQNQTTSVRPAGQVHGKSNQMDLNSKKSSQAVPIDSQSRRALANEPHPPGLNKSVPAVKNGLTVNKTGNHLEQAASLPVGRGTTAPLSGVVRNRGAAGAIHGGSANPRAKDSTAAINGTGMKRKP